MGILVGIDEAGYGPNLGPLVVAATAWEVEEPAGNEEADACGRPSAFGDSQLDLYRLLRPTVARTSHEKRLGIADSKILYRPGLGLRQLERGIHAVLATMEQTAGCWSELVELCGADPEGHHRRLCWHDGFDCVLPIDAASDELLRLGRRLSRACTTASVRPAAIRARLVFPAEFNELVDHFGTKGGALSHVTVGLLREVVEIVGANPVAMTAASPTEALNGTSRPGGRSVFAVCDKHGGRNFYTSLLQHHFAEHWIEPVYEGRGESRYEWGSAESRVAVSFRVAGEGFLPTALASMTAKYLRELSMRAFNEFWCARVADLRPTAGYYGDSRRFKSAIAAIQRELGIEDHVLWRER